nr:synaptogenesis protein syg-2-like [Lytechinus pictus]
MSTATLSFQPRQTLPVKGEEFTMTCTYSPPSNDRTVHWTHGDSQVAYESCTSASSCTSKIPNLTKYKLMGDSRSTSLTIVNLTTGDNGRYTCNVVYLDGQRSANEILEVLYPVSPSRVVMTDTQSGWQYLDYTNISVTAGEPFGITCEASRARPPVVLQWVTAKGLSAVHHNQSDVIQDGSYISRRTLIITPSRNDHGKILSCITSHPELQKNIRRSISLNVHVLPASVLLFPTGCNQSQSTVLYVQEDSPTSITCKSIGSFPATELSFWLIVDAFERTPILANVSSNRSILDDTLFDTESTITIRPDATKHGMHIVCSSYMEDVFFVKILTARLMVYGLPVDVTISIPGDMFEGAETNITCRAPNGYPTPLIHWYIGSRNLTYNSSLETSLNAADRYDAESTLTFIPTSFDHGKRLLCQAVQPTITSTVVSVNNSMVLNISTQHRGAMSVMKQ